jgi:NAD(P)-dependent dehydrogenase (short-subunit alcohol dehydrogenase family)
VRTFEGRVAVVTGAASGIGLALAQRFAAEGMKVVMADVEAAALDRAAATVRATAPALLATRVDVSRAEEVAAGGKAVGRGAGAGHHRAEESHPAPVGRPDGRGAGRRRACSARGLGVGSSAAGTHDRRMTAAV